MKYVLLLILISGCASTPKIGNPYMYTPRDVIEAHLLWICQHDSGSRHCSIWHITKDRRECRIVPVQDSKGNDDWDVYCHEFPAGTDLKD